MCSEVAGFGFASAGGWTFSWGLGLGYGGGGFLGVGVSRWIVWVGRRVWVGCLLVVRLGSSDISLSSSHDCQRTSLIK